MPMKFGLFGGAKSKGDGVAGDSLGYRNYIDYILTADALGFHSTFVVEHHFTGVGQVSASLNLLSYLAGRTSRIRLGTAVVVLPWHNPVLLAEQIATLDLLSGGRVDLGVGKGYRDYEFQGFRIPIDEAGTRFDETMAFLRQAWGPERGADGRFSFSGPNWAFDNIVIEPRPIQQPHPPFWMGAGSFESIKRAAQGGYNLLLDQIATVDLIIERVATYHAERKAAAGAGTQGGQVAVARALQIAHTQAEREAAREVRLRTLKAVGGLARGPGAERYQNIGSHADPGLADEDSALLGTVDEIIARLKRLQAGGVDYVLLVDPSGSIDNLRIVADVIMPALNSDQAAG